MFETIALKDVAELISALIKKHKNREFASDLHNVQTHFSAVMTLHASLMDENDKLMKENARLTQEIDAIKAKPTQAGIVKPAVEDELSEDEVRVLQYLADSDGRANERELASHLPMKPAKLDYYLSRLSEEKMVGFTYRAGIGRNSIYLQQNGREFLVKKGLL